LGQNRVLATSQGYELTTQDLQPVVQLLSFLIQGELTPQEIRSLQQEAVIEFRSGPVELMQSFAEIRAAVQTVVSKNDPLILGDFRQQLIGEFYKTSQSDPQQASAFLRILNQRAPVVAYDAHTGVALTQQDLVACLGYLRQLSVEDGDQVSDQDVMDAAKQVITGFSKIDPETQKMLASGTILVSLYDSNIQKLSSQQKTQLTSHYRQTVGGPPTAIRTRGPEPSAFDKLSRSGLENHAVMMKSLEDVGGSTQYWSAVKKP